MEPWLLGAIGMGFLFVLLALGGHIAVALWLTGVLGLAAIYGSFQTALSMSVSGPFASLTQIQFIVLPMFIFMGLVAGSGGIAEQAYEAVQDWVGHVRGGSAIATVVANAAFGATTGSSLVACTVFARVSAPEMRKQGYDKKFAYGVVAVAGSIGMLIPPSALAVIYGILTEESIGRLLLAGIGPGLALTLILALTIYGLCLLGWTHPHTSDSVSWRQRLRSTRKLWAPTVVGLTIVGGMLSGVFTPLEAAAVAALVVLVLAAMLRQINSRSLIQVLKETGRICGMIFIIFAGASVFSAFISLSGIPQMVSTFLGTVGMSPLLFVIVASVIYLILGCFLDGLSMLTVTIPILNPTVLSLGIDPIWYGMIVILAIETGLVTPPVGLNVYATHAAAERDVSLEDVFAGVAPFVISMVVCLLAVILFPPLSTWIPDHLR